jgi:hypothetical protein
LKVEGRLLLKARVADLAQRLLAKAIRIALAAFCEFDDALGGRCDGRMIIGEMLERSVCHRERDLDHAHEIRREILVF